MKKILRNSVLVTMTTMSVLAPAAASMSSASAATPYYTGGVMANTQSQCQSAKTTYEAKANSGGNHIVWVGNSGCVHSRVIPGKWTSGAILYAATHMVDKRNDLYRGSDRGRALSYAKYEEAAVTL